MFYRVENGRLVKAPEKGLKLFIANPTEEQYKIAGYVSEESIVSDEMPEPKDGYSVEEYYEQIDGVIYRRYQEVEMPDDTVVESDEISS